MHMPVDSQLRTGDGPRPLRREPFRSAFTLIEILMVVMILGIASAMIIPSLGSRDDLKVMGAARIVMADLIYAQNRAISRQQPCYVQFSVGAGTYRVMDDPTGSAITHPINGTPYTATLGASGSAGMVGITLKTVSFDGQSTIAFDELGAPMSWNGGTGTAALASGRVQLQCGTNILTITVEPFTGEVLVQ